MKQGEEELFEQITTTFIYSNNNKNSLVGMQLSLVPQTILKKKKKKKTWRKNLENNILKRIKGQTSQKKPKANKLRSQTHEWMKFPEVRCYHFCPEGGDRLELMKEEQDGRGWSWWCGMSGHVKAQNPAINVPEKLQSWVEQQRVQRQVMRTRLQGQAKAAHERPGSYTLNPAFISQLSLSQTIFPRI